MAGQLLIFVHGWSVTSTATYGQLPARLKREAGRRGGPALDVEHVFLGEYVSFHDAIRVEDIARAFDGALNDVLARHGKNRRCVVITHSTGGPVVREWFDRFFVQPGKLASCPMSHLIMLAPANFGSALASLGKSRLYAIKTWFDGVEPGQRVLDWLEPGSPASCALNLRWIHDYAALKLTQGKHPMFPFVLTGDAIDRKLYDHLVPATGEIGSDGVMRVAATNLNATHVVLRQPATQRDEPLASAHKRLRTLELASVTRAMPTAFKIIPGASHSGGKMGIMASVKNDDAPNATVDAILACLRVTDDAGYQALRQTFAEENAAHQAPANRLEIEHVPVLPDRQYIHDPCSMVVFRLIDSAGIHVDDVNLLLTAGPNDSPNELPSGFMIDRQENGQQPGNITCFLDHAVLAGCPAIPGPKDAIARPELVPRAPYGLRVDPRYDNRFVEYWQTMLDTSMHQLLDLIRPNETTLVDIILTRVVHKNVFNFTMQLAPPVYFRNVKPGGVA
ncbi:MAG TPA: phospholipase [Rhodanobacteraceae bacterium]